MVNSNLIGYARVSTVEQNLDNQIAALESAGCSKIFSEKMSGKDYSSREELAHLMAYVREGDTVVVSKIDRLARSVKHLLEIVDDFKDRGIGFRSLDMDVDYASPSGRLVLSILGSVAEFEHTLILERTAEGICRAKSEGKYKGRKPKSRRILDQVMPLIKDGWTRKAVAAELGISMSLVAKEIKNNNN